VDWSSQGLSSGSERSLRRVEDGAEQRVMGCAEPGCVLDTAQTSPEFRRGRGVEREAPNAGVEEIFLDPAANADRRFNKIRGLLCSRTAAKRLKREPVR